MKFAPLYFLLFLSGLVFYSCTEEEKGEAPQQTSLFLETTLSGEAQGTTYMVKYLNDSTNYKSEIDSILWVFDNDLSTWNERSLINKINAHSRTDTVFAFVDQTKNFSVVFDLSKEVYDLTDGAFDPTVFPLVKLWGFGPDGPKAKDESKIDSVLRLVGMDSANIDMIEMYEDEYFYKETQIRKGQAGVKLDFNAIAQGYSVDLIGEFLTEKGINNYMIEIGGEVLCKGVNADAKPWRIAIDKPLSSDVEREFQALLNVENEAVATSGSYRKFYEKDGKRYSHAIDPKTGFPVDHNLLSATVIAKTCAMADAYATAFLVMGPELAVEFIDSHPELGLSIYFILGKGDGFEVLMSANLSEKLIEL